MNPMYQQMMAAGIDPSMAQQQQMGYYRPLQMQNQQQGQGSMQNIMGMLGMAQNNQRGQAMKDANQADSFFSQYGY